MGNLTKVLLALPDDFEVWITKAPKIRALRVRVIKRPDDPKGVLIQSDRFVSERELTLGDASDELLCMEIEIARRDVQNVRV